MCCSPCAADVPFDLPPVLDDAFSKHVYLRRAPLKDDMIELFSDPTMINVNFDVTIIGNDGNPVEGTRVRVVREVLTSFWQLVYHPVEGTGVRVVREVLTSFWQLVYHSLNVRTQEKVPCIWHELQKTQWEATVCIIVYSVKRYNYFPLNFFVMCCHSISLV